MANAAKNQLKALKRQTKDAGRLQKAQQKFNRVQGGQVQAGQAGQSGLFHGANAQQELLPVNTPSQTAFIEQALQKGSGALNNLNLGNNPNNDWSRYENKAKENFYQNLTRSVHLHCD